MLFGETDFQIDQTDFQRVRDAVYQHCGIALGDGKISLVRARIARQMRAGHFTSVREYLDRALSDREGPAFAEFINAISTNLTGFYREPDHFRYLADSVMPSLLARKDQSRDRRILAWSAGCSSGEEAYSMAMTMLQSIDQTAVETPRCDVRILASDVSTRMLALARRGIYEAARLTPVPVSQRSRYFSPVRQQSGDGEMVASSQLRDIVKFRQVNLITSWPFGCRFDVIFCRNVMIYFDRPTQQRLVERFSEHLAPGGFLFTGHSESLTGIRHDLLDREPSIHEKPAGGDPLKSNHARKVEIL
jgi:chemotaxis protein methyltransferase CheR